MSLSILFSRACEGVTAPLVTVEVHLANGLPGLSMVGLPEMAVRESKDRVRGALLNTRFEFPARRITINLAPADLPKDGGRFDLAIALGILAASGQVTTDHLQSCEFLGELALSGHLRPTRGVLPAALAARDAGRALVVATENAEEAALIKDMEVVPARNLLEVCEHLNGQRRLPLASPPAIIGCNGDLSPDLRDVRGQVQAKRALEIAAAGGHSLLMVGPPGTGKSMLASRLPGILPRMSEREALETAAVRSISSGGLPIKDWRKRPFRAPHHTASGVALVGGGSNPRPGEISLAHNGVMFLDELPEFDRRVLEVLREPLESGHITISRATRQAEFPARFQLIAAMNPCPCGYLGDPLGECRCTPDQIARYRNRISGPLLDRIDMHVDVPRLPAKLLGRSRSATEDDSAAVRRRVEQARRTQLQRCGQINSRLVPQMQEVHCALDPDGRQLMEEAIRRLGISARAYDRILRIARSIADLNQSPRIEGAHLGEAIGFRRIDRRGVV